MSRTTLGITANYGVRVASPSDASATGAMFEVGQNNASDGTTYQNTRFNVLYNGRVGIGTDAPEYPLQVSGSNVTSGGGQATLGIYDTGTAYNGTNPGGGITFRGKFNNE